MHLHINNLYSFVQENFSSFGPNKRQEIERLLFEIAKRERRDFRECLPEDWAAHRFDELKSLLVSRRYPHLQQKKKFKPALTKIDIDPSLKVNVRQPLDLIPRHFVIEEAVKDSPLVRRIKEKFPQADFEYVGTYPSTYSHASNKKKFTAADYNDRLSTFFIVQENYDFYKKCPCSTKSVHCDYHVVSLGSGCAFECSYCYLQDYINSPGIIIPANIEDFFEEFKKYKQDIRIGSGELTDSLVFDHITAFSVAIVNFFKNYPGSTFEFKTKSSNIDNLLRAKPAGNIVVSWTMSPRAIAESAEFYTATLDERLEAARRCAAAGYKVAWHFDPLIYYADWAEDYRTLVNQVYDRVGPEHLAWISLGTLRLTPRLKKMIENRFPENTLLDEELISGYDGKLRYPLDVRVKMYTKMKEWIRQRDAQTYVYLCMEEMAACSGAQAAPLIK